MKKIILPIFIVLILFLSGCFENENNEQNDNNNNVSQSISAKEYQLDRVEEEKDDGTIVVNFISYNEGDVITLQDEIDGISYNSDLDVTTISFKAENDSSDVSFIFEGDITDNFRPQNLVRISGELKHVTFTFDDANYDYEIFVDEWDEDFIQNNGYFKPLPLSYITKV